MDLYDAMSTLRAVRRLRPDAIPEDALRRILQSAAWAPTGGNTQPFRIIAVTSRAYLKTIQSWYQKEWARYTEKMRPTASGKSVVPENVKKIIASGDYLAEHFHDTPVLLVVCFNAAKMAITDADLDRPSVVGGGSVYTAVQNILLACRAEGLGCVLTTLLCYHEAELKALLQIPEEWGTCAHIPIGYPVLKGHGAISRRPVEKLVFSDHWGQQFASGG